MGYHRADVVERAIGVLDESGLEALSMRRLAADLGVQPGALYHHFEQGRPARGGRRRDPAPRPSPAEIVAWDAELHLHCVELRDAMRRHRDGAALIAQVHRSDAEALERPMRSALERAGADQRLARVGARSLVRFVLSHEDDDAEDFSAGPGAGARRAPPPAHDVGVKVMLSRRPGGLVERGAEQVHPLLARSLHCWPSTSRIEQLPREPDFALGRSPESPVEATSAPAGEAS